MKRWGLLLAVLAVAMFMAPSAGARVVVGATTARHMAREFLGWEKEHGYTTTYRVKRCRGHVIEGDHDWLPFDGVLAYCSTYRSFVDPGIGEVWDTFTISRKPGPHCLLWGSPVFLLGPGATPDRNVYRRCPKSSSARRYAPR